MNLLADEGVDRLIVDRLRQDGHALQYVAEMEPGIDDAAVLHRATQHGALLITADQDFFERFRDLDFFRSFAINRELGVLTWGDEIDIERTPCPSSGTEWTDA